jgi:hypothetical protein
MGRYVIVGAGLRPARTIKSTLHTRRTISANGERQDLGQHEEAYEVGVEVVEPGGKVG